jgi:AraC family transcriptional regulator
MHSDTAVQNGRITGDGSALTRAPDALARLAAGSETLGWRRLHMSMISGWKGSNFTAAHPIRLVYCLSRRDRVQVRRAGDEAWTSHDLQPRRLMLFPQDEDMAIRAQGSCDVLLLSISREALEIAAERTLGRDALGQWFDGTASMSDPFLEQIVLKLASGLYRKADAQGARYADELAVTIAAHLLNEHARPPVEKGLQSGLTNWPAAQARLERARQMIEDRLEESLQLRDLAAAAGLATATFCHAFRARYGDSPHRYLVHRRVERAKTLLVSTDMPLSQVALQTGFASQAHLSTVFKRYVSQSPKQFRRGD